MEYVVYHKSRAGQPQVPIDGEWYFEPKGFDGGEPFSAGQATKQDAVDACEQWASENDDESPKITVLSEA